ncbi:MAG: hypothetical protein QOF49_2225 [Chloroflexota bacterium]|jgi:hypothetical protein|nr:hypothetical protein [Chloroflexota bacterium]
MNRRELLAAIHSGRARLDAALERIADDAMLDRIDDNWTRKDVLAHLEAWERRVVDLLDGLRGGTAPAERIETDELNARFHAANRDRSLADVRSGERDAYERMLGALDDATDDELFDGDHFTWTEGDPLAGWFRGNSDEHYEEHLEQLTRPAR